MLVSESESERSHARVCKSDCERERDIDKQSYSEKRKREVATMQRLVKFLGGRGLQQKSPIWEGFFCKRDLPKPAHHF